MAKTSPRKLTQRLDECTTAKDHPSFALNDPGTNNRITIDANGKKCQAIRVDGKLVEIQPHKCDWCVREYDTGICLFIELKSGRKELSHAMEQIANTIKWFKQYTEPFKIHPHCYTIMKKGCPSFSTKLQDLKRKFKAEYGCDFTIRESGIKIQF